MIQALLKDAADAGIDLYLDAGKLKARAANGIITEAFKLRIVDSKAALLAHLQERGAHVQSTSLSAITINSLSGEEDIVSASYAQERMWLTDQISTESHHYNIHGAFQVGPQFDVDIAERAFMAVIDRHESLRTSVFYSGTEVMQQVNNVDFCIDRRVLNSSSNDSNPELKKWLFAHGKQRFDFAANTMLSVLFIKGSRDNYLSICMPHLVSDGWSEAILIREFVTYYDALFNAQKAELRPLAIQYRDFSIWQRQWMTDDGGEVQLKYWQAKLAGLPICHSLPLDFERNDDGRRLGKTKVNRIKPETTAAIKQLASRLGLTEFMIFHAALSIVISRHSNCADVVLGTPVSNRINSQIEPLIGFFVNTLVMRIECDETVSLDDFLKQVRSVNIEAQENQFIPFSYLVEKLQPQRIRGVTPFFQIMLTMDTNDQQAFELAGEPLRYIELEGSIAKYDLTFAVEQREGLFEISLNYDTSLFTPETIEQMADGINSVLNDFSSDVDRPLLALGMQNRLTDQPSPHGHLKPLDFEFIALHDQFANVAQRCPNKVAFSDRRITLSYRQANSRANKLARYLHHRGVGEGAMVGLSCGRNVETFIGMLAILKAGAAYVPFQAEAPSKRLKHIFADTGLQLALCSTECSEKIGSLIECLNLSDITSGRSLDGYSDQDLTLDYDQRNTLCYVIYTSGSTGKPKGVMVEHNSASHYVSGLQHQLEIQPGLQYAALSSIATDLGNTSVFLAMATGGSLHIGEANVALDNHEFAEFIRSRAIQFLKLTPSHFSALVMDDKDLEFMFEQCRFIFLGGERIPPMLLNRLKRPRLASECRVVNHYGPTETTIGVCIHELNSCKGGVTPIGKPFGLGNYYLMDRYQRPVPRGVPGELYISGPGLARGYLNRPDLDDALFIHDQIDKTKSNRLYRTGDWVKQNNDDELVFIGRIDNQVKLRGFRVELSEIEQAILDHLPVDSTVVTVSTKNSANNQNLVAHIVPSDEKIGFNPHTEFPKLLGTLLPRHMIPDAWVNVDQWPLMPNGKIDIARLPEPDDVNVASIAPPQSERERELQLIWAELLMLDKEMVGKNSHFFELGGHSLLAIRLVAVVVEKYQLKTSIRDIFDHPSLAEFATFTESAKRGRCAPSIVKQNQSLQDFPLSYGQQLIWFIDQMEHGSAHYNMPSVLKVEGCFDVVAAEKSLSMIIQRHSILRTVYYDDVTTRQRIIDDVKFELRLVDISNDSSSEQYVKIQELLKHDAATAFDLRQDLPVRAQFIKSSEQTGKLLFNMHHIASDGWSMRILVKEFCQYYSAFSNGEKHVLAPLEIQYSDFAAWQKKEFHEHDFKQQLDYWVEQLDDLPEVHQLPLKAPRPINRTFNGEGISCILDQETVDKLKLLATESSCTYFMLLHAAFSILISRYGCTDDVVIGTPVANRTQRNLEPLIGFFVNTLVLRTNPKASLTFTEFLNQVREVNLAAQANQELPFELLVERLNPTRSVQTSPIFQILFTLDEVSGEPLSLPGVTITPEFQEESVSKFELTVDATALEEGYFFNFQYNTDLFARETIQNMATDFMRLLSSIAQAPYYQLGKLNQLSANQLRSLVTAHSEKGSLESGVYAGKDFKYLDLSVDSHALRNPDSIAIVHGKQKMTYGQLNLQVNRLARYICQSGVNVGDLVCVLLPRSIDLLVSILAVMRAGGVYMATDTDTPAERIQSLVKQSGANWCLTFSEFNQYLTDVPINTVILNQRLVEDEISQTSSEPLSIQRLPPAQQGAYLIYTSGSTGTPKGVMVSQQSLLAYANAALCEYALDNSDRVLQFSSTAFDIFIEEFSLTLLAGASLCLRSDSMVAGGDYFWSEVDAMGITAMTLPTSFWHQLVFELSPAVTDKMRSLKTVILGGERLSNQAVRKWLDCCGDSIQLKNTYGPTETTVVATLYRVSSATDLAQPIPIGRPLKNTRVVVIAPDKSLTPQGSIGELYIGGDSLAMSYWQDNVRTKQSFIDDLPQCEGRFYRSGDLVKYNHQGELEFIGRRDSQVKLAGYRIELGEIEHQLAHLQEVAAAVVITFVADDGKLQLCAYIKPENAKNLVSNSFLQQLRSRLGEVLPKYMVPDFITVLESLPLTTNGKIDKRKLPPPTATSTPRKLVKPSTDTEVVVGKIWAELLSRPVSDLSIHDDFFQLGGNSMQSIRLVLQLNEKFNANLTVHNVFSMPSIYQLSQLLDTKQPLESALLTALSGPVDCEAVVFCIPGVLGTAASFHALSRELSEFSLYAFNHAGVLDEKAPHASFDQITENFIREIENVQFDEPTRTQSTDPIIVLGHSLGAKIAYEIVKCLEQKGQKCILIVLDSALRPAQSTQSSQAGSQPDPAILHDLEVLEEVVKLATFLSLSITSESERKKMQSRLSDVYVQHAWLSETHRISATLGADILGVYASDSVITPLNKINELTSGEVIVEHSDGSHDTMLIAENAASCADVIRQFLNARSGSFSQNRQHTLNKKLTTKRGN